MAYLPKNKYKVLYTNGNKYKLKNTGKPYTGEYLLLSDGRLFAGKDPSDLKGRLIPISDLSGGNNILTATVNNRVYKILDKNRAKRQDSYIPILASKPLPTESDYNKGYLNRYLSDRLNTKEYQEIDKDTYMNFGDRNYNTTLNKVFFIKWSLTDDNELENTAFLRDLNQTLPGIFDFFPNKGEYGIRGGIIRLNPTTRVYPDGENIDQNLPGAYQLGNSNPNSIENVDVPKYQYCGNCIFHQKGYCTKWEAQIRHKFWCAAFKGKAYQEPKMVEEPVEETIVETPVVVETTPTPPPMTYSGGGGGGY